MSGDAIPPVDLRRILDTIDDLILILDRERTVLAANRAVTELTGLSEKELSGRKCHDVLCCQNYSRKECPLSALVASDAVDSVEREVQYAGCTFLATITPAFPAASSCYRASCS